MAVWTVFRTDLRRWKKVGVLRAFGSEAALRVARALHGHDVAVATYDLPPPLTPEVPADVLLYDQGLKEWT
jgi:hypothetical protein